MPISRDAFADRLARGPLLLDGAVGTELERRGCACPAPLWSARALIEAPDLVRDIHRDYVAAGAAIIVANTFRTSPRALHAAGLDAAGPTLVERAVALARAATTTEAPAAAAGPPVLVAASIGPAADCYDPSAAGDEATLRAEHARLADWIAAADPDLAWIETIGTVREVCAATQACRDRALPFVISLIVNEAGDLLGGEPLADAIAIIEAADPLAVGLNCIPPRGLTTLLPRLRKRTARPLVAYGHINDDRPLPGWSYAQALDPPAYAAETRRWAAGGAALIGGCCGTTPAHIQAAADATRRG
jgi:S-methylmethionine-dependent homocysteine/selenocysteine methylase